MDSDTALVSGMLLVVLSIPALLSAWSDKRLPVIGTLLLFIGCALAVWAWRMKPGGYSLDQMPELIYGTIARVLP